MKTSEYLYELDPKSIKDLPYETALITKIQAANTLIEKLVRKDDMKDNVRMIAVSNAIKFNQDLLAELGYSTPEISKLVRS